MTSLWRVSRMSHEGHQVLFIVHWLINKELALSPLLFTCEFNRNMWICGEILTGNCHCSLNKSPQLWSESCLLVLGRATIKCGYYWIRRWLSRRTQIVSGAFVHECHIRCHVGEIKFNWEQEDSCWMVELLKICSSVFYQNMSLIWDSLFWARQLQICLTLYREWRHPPSLHMARWLRTFVITLKWPVTVP